MSPILRACAALLLGLSAAAPVRDVRRGDVDFADFRFEEIAAKRAESGKPWLEFLRSSALYVGDYSLAAGAVDGQSPHREDEVYYVVRGRARFTAGDGAAARTVDAAAGSVLFVRAGVAHHFHDVTEPLDLLVFFSTARPAPPRTAVAEVLQRYVEAYNRRDAAALARLYTEDGRFVPPAGDVVQGRDALQSFWSKALGGTLALELDDFEAQSGIGWARGTWNLAAAAATPARSGRFVLGLRQAGDGAWRISVDTFNEPPRNGGE